MSDVRAAADRLLSLAGTQVQHHTARWAEGSAVHHIEAGSGEPAVLVHGGGGGCANWFRVIGPLSQHFRVLAPDLPGFGESGRAALRGPLGRQAAEFLDAWLARVGVASADIIATSFGALAALRLAQTRPERVKRLVLIDAVGLGAAVPFLLRLAALPVLGPVLLRPSRRGGELLFDRILTGGRVPLPVELRRALLDYLWECDVAGVAAQLRLALPRFTGVRGQREVITPEELRALHAPLLLIWGERDRFVPIRHARRAARQLADARLVAIPDAGHSPNWETPGVLLSALGDFLGFDSGRPA